MRSRRIDAPAAAAAKAGFSTASACRIEADPRLPPQRKNRTAGVARIRSPACGRAIACRCWKPPLAEALWWRCHRRIITDYLILAGETVEHIFARGKEEPARPIPAARPTAGGGLIYKAEEPPEM